MFAVVEISGKQYKIQEKDVLEVDHIPGSAGDVIKIEKILMVDDGKTTNVGTPYIEKAVVSAKILDQIRGEKIHVARYKSKVRYRKSRGFRASLTKLEIVSIVQK
jgi:large subunit ribosomal protein L21